MSDLIGLEEVKHVVENFVEDYDEEVKHVVENFVEDYDRNWGRLNEEVESIGRTDEEEEKDWWGDYTTATARVHLVLKDEIVIGNEAFRGSMNLWKVTATHASEVGDGAFRECVNLNEAILPSANRVGYGSSFGEGAFEVCYALRHITLHPNVNIDRTAFFLCLSLEVLATCAGFELDTGDKTDGYLDPTVAITRYPNSQYELDTQQRDVFLTYNFMLKLCNHHIDNNTDFVRATPHDPLAHFLLNNEDIASNILSFFGMKWGENDFRNASHGRLLELALQKKVLRKELNGHDNISFWGVRVDSNGEVVA